VTAAIELSDVKAMLGHYSSLTRDAMQRYRATGHPAGTSTTLWGTLPLVSARESVRTSA
jgi:hypothetical protein